MGRGTVQSLLLLLNLSRGALELHDPADVIYAGDRGERLGTASGDLRFALSVDQPPETVSASPRKGARPLRVGSLAEALAVAEAAQVWAGGRAVRQRLHAWAVARSLVQRGARPIPELVAGIRSRGRNAGGLMRPLGAVRAALAEACLIPAMGSGSNLAFLSSEWVERGVVEALLGIVPVISRIRAGVGTGRRRRRRLADALVAATAECLVAVLGGADPRTEAVGRFCAGLSAALAEADAARVPPAADLLLLAARASALRPVADNPRARRLIAPLLRAESALLAVGSDAPDDFGGDSFAAPFPPLRAEVDDMKSVAGAGPGTVADTPRVQDASAGSKSGGNAQAAATLLPLLTVDQDPDDIGDDAVLLESPIATAGLGGDDRLHAVSADATASSETDAESATGRLQAPEAETSALGVWGDGTIGDALYGLDSPHIPSPMALRARFWRARDSNRVMRPVPTWAPRRRAPAPPSYATAEFDAVLAKLAVLESLADLCATSAMWNTPYARSRSSTPRAIGGDTSTSLCLPFDGATAQDVAAAIHREVICVLRSELAVAPLYGLEKDQVRLLRALRCLLVQRGLRLVRTVGVTLTAGVPSRDATQWANDVTLRGACAALAESVAAGLTGWAARRMSIAVQLHALAHAVVEGSGQGSASAAFHHGWQAIEGVVHLLSSRLLDDESTGSEDILVGHGLCFLLSAMLTGEHTPKLREAAMSLCFYDAPAGAGTALRDIFLIHTKAVLGLSSSESSFKAGHILAFQLGALGLWKRLASVLAAQPSSTGSSGACNQHTVRAAALGCLSDKSGKSTAASAACALISASEGRVESCDAVLAAVELTGDLVPFGEPSKLAALASVHWHRFVRIYTGHGNSLVPPACSEQPSPALLTPVCFTSLARRPREALKCAEGHLRVTIRALADPRGGSSVMSPTSVATSLEMLNWLMGDLSLEHNILHMTSPLISSPERTRETSVPGPKSHPTHSTRAGSGGARATSSGRLGQTLRVSQSMALGAGKGVSKRPSSRELGAGDIIVRGAGGVRMQVPRLVLPLSVMKAPPSAAGSVTPSAADVGRRAPRHSRSQSMGDRSVGGGMLPKFASPTEAKCSGSGRHFGSSAPHKDEEDRSVLAHQPDDIAVADEESGLFRDHGPAKGGMYTGAYPAYPELTGDVEDDAEAMDQYEFEMARVSQRDDKIRERMSRREAWDARVRQNLGRFGLMRQRGNESDSNVSLASLVSADAVVEDIICPPDVPALALAPLSSTERELPLAADHSTSRKSASSDVGLSGGRTSTMVSVPKVGQNRPSRTRIARFPSVIFERVARLRRRRRDARREVARRAEADWHYQAALLQRPLTWWRGLHEAFLSAVLIMAVAANGTLAKHASLSHVAAPALPVLLHAHLSHPRNRGVVAGLLSFCRSLPATHAEGAVRLLRLCAPCLFRASLYGGQSGSALTGGSVSGGSTGGRVARGIVSVVSRRRMPSIGGPRNVVIKAIDLPTSPGDRNTVVDAFSEIRILATFSDEPWSCTLLDYGVDDAHIYLVLQSYPRSLADWRREVPGKTERVRSSVLLYLRIFSAVVDAVAEFHARGGVHFDLKCSNILLEPLDGERGSDVSGLPFRPVLADYGESLLFAPGEPRRTERSRGTECVKSPEMLSFEDDATAPQDVGPAVDVWSLGCLLFELCIGRVLFDDTDWVSFFLRVTLETEPLFTMENARALEGLPSVRPLLEFALVRDPAARPTVTQLQARLAQELGGLMGQPPSPMPTRRAALQPAPTGGEAHASATGTRPVGPTDVEPHLPLSIWTPGVPAQLTDGLLLAPAAHLGELFAPPLVAARLGLSSLVFVTPSAMAFGSVAHAQAESAMRLAKAAGLRGAVVDFPSRASVDDTGGAGNRERVGGAMPVAFVPLIRSIDTVLRHVVVARGASTCIPQSADDGSGSAPVSNWSDDERSGVLVVFAAGTEQDVAAVAVAHHLVSRRASLYESFLDVSRRCLYLGLSPGHVQALLLWQDLLADREARWADARAVAVCRCGATRLAVIGDHQPKTWADAEWSAFYASDVEVHPHSPLCPVESLSPTLPGFLFARGGGDTRRTEPPASWSAQACARCGVVVLAVPSSSGLPGSKEVPTPREGLSPRLAPARGAASLGWLNRGTLALPEPAGAWAPTAALGRRSSETEGKGHELLLVWRGDRRG